MSFTTEPGITIGAGTTITPSYSVVTNLYNRGLSGSEVNQNFNALRGRYGV